MLGMDCSTLTSLMMSSDEKQSSLSSAANAQSRIDPMAEIAGQFSVQHHAACHSGPITYGNLLKGSRAKDKSKDHRQ